MSIESVILTACRRAGFEDTTGKIKVRNYVSQQSTRQQYFPDNRDVSRETLLCSTAVQGPRQEV